MRVHLQRITRSQTYKNVNKLFYALAYYGLSDNTSHYLHVKNIRS